MSHYAMGWAQRQKVGDPAAKAVLQHMCYVMRDESLLIYTSIRTLVEFTEFEERTVRKAMQHLETTGVLLDTGHRKNNVVVWRIPGYEAWLEHQRKSPPKNERASETDAAAIAQVAELARQKKVSSTPNQKPSQKGEGQPQALAEHASSPPVFVPEGDQALPKTGVNLPPDDPSNRSPERASELSPSGSLALGEYDRDGRRAYWHSAAMNICESDAWLFGVVPRGTKFAAWPIEIRAGLPEKIRNAVNWALGQEQTNRLHHSAIHDGVKADVAKALAPFMPPKPSARPRAAANVH
jgi:hypothetical protein